jgi:glycosyltransferase involved in cell wall biosynthesis
MLLTITIPTFNRLSKLKKQIASITYQIKKLKLQKKVQILVGENTNLSNQIISNNYLSRFKKINLKIIRNNQNIGYAKNLNNLILNSQGRFIWLLSDDDILQPNALISIVSAIKKNNNVDYYTFRSFTGGSKKKNTKQDLYFFDLPKTNKDNYVLMDGKEFLKKYWISVIFISINVFNTQKMKTHLKFVEYYTSNKTKLIHVENNTEEIGKISYYNHWLQYVFEPYQDNFIFSKSCLIEITNKISELNSSLRKKKNG